jgi:hypothetical protein
MFSHVFGERLFIFASWAHRLLERSAQVSQSNRHRSFEKEENFLSPLQRPQLKDFILFRPFLRQKGPGQPSGSV